ncbi:sugar-binding protein [Actinoplanes sp. ATCC 53533]|uniref:ricin-type beta-trefoil lectin domain protein n=1 Tax=Actinoplanes sp. ATCC 53533 TaxID=1288362 RepID=UPI000F76E913|nr:ricin-type beta-trefoil lectin domain protein [Actinoplanes sp. ATCC 53533]RSM51477.1 sugar-binding protein [Actinoplanes sp. ATCC 53533]
MRGTGPLWWSGLRRPRRFRTALILSLSATLVVTSLPAQALGVPGDGMSREGTAVTLPKLPSNTPAEQDEQAEVDLTTADEVPVEEYQPTAVAPWQEDSGVVDLTGLEPGDSKPVDDLPIALGVPEGGDPADLAGNWTVDLAAPEASQASDVAGLIMKIVPPVTAGADAEVALSVDYTAFADLYGPQAADRFGIVMLPDCVYDAPGTGECESTGEAGEESATVTAEAVPSEVQIVPAAAAASSGVSAAAASASAKSAASSSASVKAAKGASKRRIVSADVPLDRLLDDSGTGGAGGGVMTRAAVDANGGVVGAMDTGASAAGDFTATPLLSSGSWAAGSSSGAFTYSYQVQVPETAGGLIPKVNLGYSSQSVDGRTSATNNQASWIGDGWDYSAGAITRTYANCRQDSKKAGANNTKHRTADLCWASKNATMSLGGASTELVWDEGKKKWFTANGDGSVIEQKFDTGLANGDKDGEYWVVTTRDGTKYHFGRNRLPGWSDHGDAADDPVTKSVLTVPVYSNHSDEPCYQGTTIDDYKKSFCTEGWRWALDYVEDVHGNAMSLWWERESNYYARNFDFKKPVPYHRAGYLTHIDYGQRKDNLFSAVAPARVAFTVKERCYDKGALTCSEENFTSKNPGDYRHWYDTPANLRCAAPTPKVLCWNAAPTFFSRKRLDKITTMAQRRTDTTARQAVDDYQLKQSFPILKTGPNTALWLESIARTGYGRNGTDDEKTTLNPVRFESNVDNMPNRVLRGANDPRPGFSRLRIGRVINEYGGETVISYKKPEGNCASGSGLPGKADTAELRTNTRLCYPAFWHPDPAVEDIDWFHKYVVASVEELPAVDGAFGTTTNYAYKSAGWKLAEGEFTKKSTRTYSQFAGFQQLTVLTGEDNADFGAKRTKSVTRYFRGMGDTVGVDDITGAEIAKDREPFAGRIAEELTYSTAGAADDDWLTRSITYPQAVELARRDRGADDISPLQAWRVLEPKQVTFTKSSGTGEDKRTERKVETRTKYDDEYGLPTDIESFGDTGKTGDESCAKMEYVHHTGKNIIGLTKQVRTSATSCADATFDDLTSLSSASRTAYDGLAYGAVLPATTRGLATQTYSLKADGTGFQLEGTTVFDGIGRVTSKADRDSRTSTITYEPDTGQAFRVREKNHLKHEQVREVEPGRGVGIKTTDVNGHVSQAQYDPLGRMQKAWGPGRATSAVPDFEAIYTTPTTDPDSGQRKPPYVTTKTRGHEGRIQTSVTIYDGMGRQRQSQEEGTGGGRLITDTLYNSSGEVFETNNAYYTAGTPNGQLFKPDAPVPNATRYKYDGLGRVVQELPILRGDEMPNRATKYEYGADFSTVINPTGAVSYRTYSDALGRTSRVDTFTDAARTAFTSMSYQYDARGQLAKATNSENAKISWSWTYDRRGRMIAATDPDSGVTSTSYDDYDRPLTATNARGVTVWNDYDDLSRPTEQRLNNKSGQLTASFTYDNAPGGKGLPATATRYTDGLPYTQSIGGYTDDYQPTSTTLTLPSTVASTWGLKTSYSYNYSYTDTGLTESATLPAIGGFAEEKLLVRYTKDGLPLSVSGKDWYGAETAYSPHGQLMRSTLGAQPYRVWALANYDDASGALTQQQVYREKTDDKTIVGGNLVSQRSYGYDDAGNVTAVREQAVGIEERQCFTHDPLGQLKKAWTAKDQESCTAGPVGTDGTVNVAAGKDNTGYWQEYEYDLLGNRTKLVQKDITGATAKDATTGYTYGKADGSQPSTLTKVTKKYTTPAGAAITAEAERLYELTGETKTVTSQQNGDKQELAWTYDGKIERISGQGENGKTSYVGLASKCLDLKSAMPVAAQPIQLYTCNGGLAQKWRFTPTPGQSDANVGAMSVHDGWCLQPAANTAGSAFGLQKCDGSAAQQIKRLSSTNQLSHPASGLCVAAKDGATADTTPIVLAACASTNTAQLWQAQNETRHIYGPGGSRLLTVQGKQATLYLGEAELTVQQGGAPVNTQRSYSVPGGTVVRNAYGFGAAGLNAVVGDHQGSPYAEVNLSGSMQVRIRKQDPFGNQRGTVPLGMHIATNDGFLGANRDDASGYVPLGARLYDPVVGRFLSADPVLDLADPLQSNGYAYAHNNPVTHSDPTGLSVGSVALTASEMAAALAGVGLTPAQVAEAQANANKSLTSIILSAAWGILSEFIGLTDAMNCFGGDLWACGSLILGAIPWAKVMKIGKIAKAIDRTIAAIQAWRTAKKAAEAVLAAARAAERMALQAKKAAIERAKKAAQAAQKKAAEKANTTSNKAANASKKTGNPVQKDAQAKANPGGASSGGGGKGGGSKPGGSSGSSARSSGGSSGGGGAGKSGGGEGGKCNSFVPGTKVLMADGSAKPIEDVKVGDEVKATDPETGESRVETVTAEIKGEGVKHLVKVTIDTDGDKDTADAEVTATDGHPFWVPELGEWIRATELETGQWLQTSAGTFVQITAIERWTSRQAAVHNLTVSDIHTYYVVVGAAPVLVHNCDNDAAESAKSVQGEGDTVDLYRAVGVREFQGVEATGGFHPGGNSLEGRQFAFTQDEALAYADWDSSKVAILKVTVQRSALAHFDFSRNIDVSIFRNGVVTVQPGRQNDIFHEALQGIQHVL